MTRRSSRLLSSTTFAALFAGLAFGCAANAPEAEGSTSDAIITKCAKGYSLNCDVCEPDECGKLIRSCWCEPDAPAYCTAKPKDTPGFDPLVLNVSGDVDTAFADQLAAAGCKQQRSYDIGTSREYSWATAICPDTFTLSSLDAASDRAGTLPYDACTGTPGAHQVVIAWVVGQCLPPRCIPQAGCGSLTCLRQEQEEGSGGTP